uniref:ZP domain-containing protein n=1 Tax=Caenorhabditis tropicalis TaxID=1561998 RepID=A0A1I7U7E3_9PELO
MAKRCEESAYMFDVKKGYRIDETPIRIINASVESQSTARCPNGRIEFIVTRKADVPSFGISLGVKSIRSCMQACVNAGQFYCKSVQFDSTSNECFVSDETSDGAVPSTTLDIFEPFCVPRSDENTCNRPYSFEKMITSKLVNSSLIKEIPNQSTEKCLQKCINQEDCKSVNYNVLTRSCQLSSTSKSESSTLNDENFDFYERSCPYVTPSATSLSSFIPQPPTLYPEVSSRYTMAERGRQLSDRFINKTGVENVQDCWSLCINSKTHCELISFSSISNQCLLSVIKPFDASLDIKKLTKPSDSFDTYSTSSSTSTTSFPSSLKSSSSVTSTVSTTTKSSGTKTSKGTTKSFSSNESLEDLNNIFDITENFMDTTTANNPTRSRAHALPNAETKSKSQSSESTALLPIDPELVGLEDSTPIQLPLSSGIAHIEISRLSVSAHCLPQGINITFDLSQNNVINI